MPELPEYVCHKKVHALKIESVENNGTDSTADENPIVTINFVDRRFEPLRGINLRGKPTPQAGWYMVQYEDGYISFSPEKVFEQGYTAAGVLRESGTKLLGLCDTLEAIINDLHPESRDCIWEWGEVPAKSDEEHCQDFAGSLSKTRQYFDLAGNLPLSGVYVPGSDRVLCHTGTSPTAGQRARFIAACGPQTILLLISAIRQLGGANEGDGSGPSLSESGTGG